MSSRTTESDCDLSIIIVSYNTRALLLALLDSLPNAAGDLRYEIIVVDNGSTDGSASALQDALPTVHLIANQQNLGFVEANNQGIAVAKGDFLLLLNSDTLPSGASICRLVDFARSHPEVGIVGARLINPDGTPQISWADFPTLLSEMTGRNTQRHARRFATNPAWNTLEVDWVNGAAMLCRSEMLSQIGGLDSAIFMYSEETDLCYRAHQHGWKVVHLFGAVVTHIGGASSASHSPLKLKLLYGSKIYFFRKHSGLLWSLLLRLALILATLWGLARRTLQWFLKRDGAIDYASAMRARLALLGWLLRPGNEIGNRPR